MGREKGVFWHCLVAAYLAYPIRYFVLDESYWFMAVSSVSGFVFDHFSKEWDSKVPKRQKLMK